MIWTSDRGDTGEASSPRSPSTNTLTLRAERPPARAQPVAHAGPARVETVDQRRHGVHLQVQFPRRAGEQPDQRARQEGARHGGTSALHHHRLDGTDQRQVGRHERPRFALVPAPEELGRTAKDVDAERALDYVGGYVLVNDVSARDFQMVTSQWMAGKVCDTFAPMGPCEAQSVSGQLRLVNGGVEGRS